MTNVRVFHNESSFLNVFVTSCGYFRYIDNHNRISATDCRKIRRIVRDSNYRNIPAEKTLDMWPSIRRGEESNIFPYLETADAIVNSSLAYELCVLKKYAEQWWDIYNLIKISYTFKLDDDVPADDLFIEKNYKK